MDTAPGNEIKVAIRVRPLLPKEHAAGLKSRWHCTDTMICPDSSQSSNCSYQFDRVFDESVSNAMVYNELASDIVKQAMIGFHGTVFTYGQSGSGKTHTIDALRTMAIKSAYDYVENCPAREFLMRVSYIELYNERLMDLLADESLTLNIREDNEKNVFIEGLTEIIVTSQDHVKNVLAKGNARRTFAETKLNDKSSRAHCIFRLVIESREREDPEHSSVYVSYLNLVDLAGSERPSENSGERLREGVAINLSLMTLSNVIRKLSGEQREFINYRDSKLTRILQNALEGNSKTAILCTVAPFSVEETHSTLKFALNAKMVKTKPQQNEVLTSSAMLKKSQLEITLLKNKIKELEGRNLTQENEELQRQREKWDHLIHEFSSFLCVSSKARVEKRVLDKKRRETVCVPQMYRATDIEVPEQRFTSALPKGILRNSLMKQVDNVSSSPEHSPLNDSVFAIPHTLGSPLVSDLSFTDFERTIVQEYAVEKYQVKIKKYEAEFQKLNRKYEATVAKMKRERRMRSGRFVTTQRHFEHDESLALDFQTVTFDEGNENFETIEMPTKKEKVPMDEEVENTYLENESMKSQVTMYKEELESLRAHLAELTQRVSDEGKIREESERTIAGLHLRIQKDEHDIQMWRATEEELMLQFQKERKRWNEKLMNMELEKNGLGILHEEGLLEMPGVGCLEVVKSDQEEMLRRHQKELLCEWEQIAKLKEELNEQVKSFESKVCIVEEEKDKINKEWNSLEKAHNELRLEREEFANERESKASIESLHAAHKNECFKIRTTEGDLTKESESLLYQTSQRGLEMYRQENIVDKAEVSDILEREDRLLKQWESLRHAEKKFREEKEAHECERMESENKKAQVNKMEEIGNEILMEQQEMLNGVSDFVKEKCTLEGYQNDVVEADGKCRLEEEKTTLLKELECLKEAVSELSRRKETFESEIGNSKWKQCDESIAECLGDRTDISEKKMLKEEWEVLRKAQNELKDSKARFEEHESVVKKIDKYCMLEEEIKRLKEEVRQLREAEYENNRGKEAKGTVAVDRIVIRTGDSMEVREFDDQTDVERQNVLLQKEWDKLEKYQAELARQEDNVERKIERLCLLEEEKEQFEEKKNMFERKLDNFRQAKKDFMDDQEDFRDKGLKKQSMLGQESDGSDILSSLIEYRNNLGEERQQLTRAQEKLQQDKEAFECKQAESQGDKQLLRTAQETLDMQWLILKQSQNTFSMERTAFEMEHGKVQRNILRQQKVLGETNGLGEDVTASRNTQDESGIATEISGENTTLYSEMNGSADCMGLFKHRKKERRSEEEHNGDTKFKLNSECSYIFEQNVTNLKEAEENLQREHEKMKEQLEYIQHEKERLQTLQEKAECLEKEKEKLHDEKAILEMEKERFKKEQENFQGMKERIQEEKSLQENWTRLKDEQRQIKGQVQKDVGNSTERLSKWDEEMRFQNECMNRDNVSQTEIEEFLEEDAKRQPKELKNVQLCYQCLQENMIVLEGNRLQEDRGLEKEKSQEDYKNEISNLMKDHLLNNNEEIESDHLNKHDNIDVAHLNKHKDVGETVKVQNVSTETDNVSDMWRDSEIISLSISKNERKTFEEEKLQEERKNLNLAEIDVCREFTAIRVLEGEFNQQGEIVQKEMEMLQVFHFEKDMLDVEKERIDKEKSILEETGRFLKENEMLQVKKVFQEEKEGLEDKEILERERNIYQKEEEMLNEKKTFVQELQEECQVLKEKNKVVEDEQEYVQREKDLLEELVFQEEQTRLQKEKELVEEKQANFQEEFVRYQKEIQILLEEQKRLQKEKEMTEEKQTHFQEQLVRYQKEIQTLKEDKSVLLGEQDILQKEKEFAEKKQSSFEDKYELYQKEIQILKDEKSVFQDELTRLQKEKEIIEEKQGNFQEELVRYHNEIQILREEKSVLLGEQDRLQKEKEMVEEKENNFQKEHVRYLEEIQILHEDLARLHKEKETIEEKQTNFQEEHARYQKEIQTLQEEQMRLQKEKKMTEEKQTHFQEELVRYQKEIQTLQDEQMRLQKEKKMTEEKQTHFQEEHARYQKEIQTLQEEQMRLQKEKKMTEEKQTHFQEELVRYQKEIQTLQEEQMRLQKEKETTEEKQTHFQEQLVRYQKDIKILQEEKSVCLGEQERLQKENEFVQKKHFEGTYEQYQNDIQILLEEQKRLQKEKEMNEEKQTHFQEQLVRYQKEIQTLKEDKSVLLGEQDILQKEKEFAEKKQSSFEDKYELHQKEIQILKDEKSVFQDELTRLQKEKEIIEEKQGNFQEELVRYQNEIQILQEEKERLQGRDENIQEMRANLKRVQHDLTKNREEVREREMSVDKRIERACVLEEERKRFHDECEELRKAQENLRKEKSSLDEREVCLKEENRRLQKEWQNVRLSHEGLLEKQRDLDNESERLQSAHESLRQSQVELSEEQKGFQQKYVEVNEKVQSAFADEINTLESGNQDGSYADQEASESQPCSPGLIEQLEDDLYRAEDRIEHLENLITKGKAMLAEKTELASQANNRALELEEAVTALKSKLDTQNSLLDRKTDECDKLKKVQENYKAAVREKEELKKENVSLIRGLVGDKEYYEGIIRQLKLKLRDTQNADSSFFEQKSNSSQNLPSLDQMRAIIEFENASKFLELGTLRKTVEKQKAQISCLEDEGSQLQAECSKLQLLVDNETVRSEAQRSTVNQAVFAKRRSEEELAQLRKKLAKDSNSQARDEDSHDEVTKVLRSQLAEKDQQINQLCKTIDGRDMKWHTIAHKYKILIEQNHDHQKNLIKLQKENAELDKLRADCADFEKLRSDSAELARLRKEVAEHQTAKLSNGLEVMKLQKENKEIKACLEQLKSELQEQKKQSARNESTEHKQQQQTMHQENLQLQAQEHSKVQDSIDHPHEEQTHHYPSHRTGGAVESYVIAVMDREIRDLKKQLHSELSKQNEQNTSNSSQKSFGSEVEEPRHRRFLDSGKDKENQLPAHY